MKCNTRSPLLVFTMVTALGSLLMLDWWISRPLAAQPPESVARGQLAEVQPADRAEKHERKRHELGRRLDDIKRTVKRAEKQKDEARVRQLRSEGKRILALLDDIADEPPAEEESKKTERQEIEWHRMHLELERAELEANFGRLELITRLARIAKEQTTAAAYAVVQIDEFVEEEEVVPFLEELLENSQNATVKRIIRVKLAELYRNMDRPEDAKDQLRALVIEK